MPLMSDRVYNWLKYVAQIVLPAAAALYFALAGIWDLPKAEEVVGTTTAVDAFLGIVLGLSTRKYNNSDVKYDGSIELEKTHDDKEIFSINLKDVEDPTKFLKEKNEAVFKVNL